MALEYHFSMVKGFQQTGLGALFRDTRKYMKSKSSFLDFIQSPLGRAIGKSMLQRGGGVPPSLEAAQGIRTALHKVQTACVFEASGRHTIRCSETLGDMLLRTDIDVPANQIRAPHPAVCIEVPASVKIPLVDPDTDRIDFATEIYVLDLGFDAETGKKISELNNANIKVTTPSGQAASMFLPPGGFFILATARGRDCIKMDEFLDRNFVYSIDPYDERYVMDHKVSEGLKTFIDAGGVSDVSQDDFYKPISCFVFNLFLYMSQPREEADVAFSPSSRLEAAKNTPAGPLREATEENFYNSKATQVYVVGFKTEDELRRASMISADVAQGTKKPHWRRGHWHRYWTGPRDVPEERKQITRWVKPMIIAGLDGQDAPPPVTYVVK